MLRRKTMNEDIKKEAYEKLVKLENLLDARFELVDDHSQWYYNAYIEAKLRILNEKLKLL